MRGLRGFGGCLGFEGIRGYTWFRVLMVYIGSRGG